MQNILSKYTNSHIISGNPMRYSIFHSLTFLETIVRKPMQEQMDEKQNEDESINTNLVRSKNLIIKNIFTYNL